MNDKITPFQLAFLLIHAQIGLGFISLPFDIFMKAKGDSWISVLITGLTLQIVIMLLWALMMRFPTKNIFGIAEYLLGKWIGKTITLFYSIYFIIMATSVAAKFSFIIKAWMLPLTPQWFLIGFMLFTVVYIVKDPLLIMVRFFVISSIVLIGFIGLSAYALKDANLTYILPVGKDGALAALKGVQPSLYSYQGFEMLWVIYPFVKTSGKRDVLKAATIANMFVTLFYTFLVITCLLFFSPAELKLVPEPVFYLIKSFSFKIIERPDLLFTSMWIVLVATTLMNLFYAASLGLAFVKNAKDRKKYVYVVAIVCFMAAMYFQGKYDIQTISKVNNQLLVPCAFGIPILLLLVSVLFKKKERGNG